MEEADKLSQERLTDNRREDVSAAEAVHNYAGSIEFFPEYALSTIS
jgi:hypothetical protein